MKRYSFCFIQVMMELNSTNRSVNFEKNTQRQSEGKEWLIICCAFSSVVFVLVTLQYLRLFFVYKRKQKKEKG